MIPLLHTRRTELQSASSVTPSSCRFGNFIYSSFLVLLLHVSHSAPSYSFSSASLPRSSFQTSLCISQTSVQNGCLSLVCLLPLHLGVSGHTRTIHRFTEYNHRNTMALLLTDCSSNRLPIDPPACHHALLTSYFQLCFQNSHHCRCYFSRLCRNVLQAPLNDFC